MFGHHTACIVDYLIERDSVLVEHEPWDGGPISINVDGLANGTYVFVIAVHDIVGYSAVDEVIVTVTEPATSPTTTPTGPPPPPLDPTLLLIIGIAAAGVIVIVLVLIMVKKKKS